ncbi:MAG: hypothetical protein DRN24_01655, partial [Thermoplasmata archaeon]
TVYVGSNTYTTNSEGDVTIKLSDKGSYDIYSEKEGFVRSEKKNIRVKKDVEIIKPVNNTLYIANIKVKDNLKRTWIIGFIDIEVDATEDVKKVEFYINGELKYIDNEKPFIYRLNERSFFKKTRIMVKSYVSEKISFKILRMFEKIRELSGKQENKMYISIIKNFLEKTNIQILKQGDIDVKDVITVNIFPHLYDKLCIM